MDIKGHINAIELLCHEMETASQVKKVIIYTSIKQLSDDIISHVDTCRREGEPIDQGHAKGYLHILLSHVRQIAEIDSSNHLIEQQFVWLRTEIGKLKSKICFDL